MEALNLDYKFTDSQVRANSALRDAARVWLEGYTGDFSFLREAQGLVAQGYHLPTNIVRGVLNCMRGDARGIPYLHWAVEEAQLTEDAVVIPMRRPRRERVPTRHPFDLNARYKFDWIISSHKSARVVHIVWHMRSGIRYYPQADDKYTMFVATHCSNKYYWAGRGARRDAEFVEQIPQGFRMCKSCQRNYAERVEV